VTRKPVALSRAESAVEAIAQSQSDVQQGSLAGRLVVRDGSFEEVARTEVLVKKARSLKRKSGS